jgi:hypothetical protein
MGTQGTVSEIFANASQLNDHELSTLVGQLNRQISPKIILCIIRFCANIQLPPSVPKTKLGYCRGDFFCHPDNLVGIQCLQLSDLSASLMRYMLFTNEI